ncbi:MAG: RluA family pseudouridine synthase [Pseudomonadales bacterium]|mgnify:FL=1|jgi:23S rRNA pseudouridine1911/1915/1917 synthase|uniref:RNA-binding S4 domain-containing protein n=1 Tax=marine metagenome TaxID=408172 RepID=A0A381R2Y4_9ZZZZ|nr:RluA family pseudouridine synthase [Pseudomonadales bacterium]MEE3133016.1 RluA family pseudouridine synthase [Pseudomonadota bacterium]|tara:strand:+ start:317 stop:1273 length:957 start_codon:yes stop_codon:yes gene_type:complete
MLGKSIERAETLAKTHVGQRIDKALAEIWLEFSRAQITNWMRIGAIQIDGKVVKPNAKVCGGERVRLNAAMPASEDWLVAEALDFSVVYEDQDLLIVDKPRGLVVHPGAGNLTGTLVNGLINRRAELAQLPRAGIVHRLDKDTTGLMVVAANNKALKILTRSIAKHDVDRRYVAICEGILRKRRRLDMAIGRDFRDRTRQRVRDDGRDAVTRVKPIETFRGHTAVEAFLETGRTHQVRVHLAAIGHPLVGDRRYGARARLPKQPTEKLVDAVRKFDRQALHAAGLAFRHPSSDERVEFESDLPSDMQFLVETLRQDQS